MEHLETAGNTVRLQKMHPQQAVCVALLMGNTLASHYWMNIFGNVTHTDSLSRKWAEADARLRYYITEEDYATLVSRMHVQPQVIPRWIHLCLPASSLVSGGLPWVCG